MTFLLQRSWGNWVCVHNARFFRSQKPDNTYLRLPAKATPALSHWNHGKILLARLYCTSCKNLSPALVHCLPINPGPGLSSLFCPSSSESCHLLVSSFFSWLSRHLHTCSTKEPLQHSVPNHTHYSVNQITSNYPYYKPLARTGTSSTAQFTVLDCSWLDCAATAQHLWVDLQRSTPLPQLLPYSSPRASPETVRHLRQSSELFG